MILSHSFSSSCSSSLFLHRAQILLLIAPPTDCTLTLSDSLPGGVGMLLFISFSPLPLGAVAYRRPLVGMTIKTRWYWLFPLFFFERLKVSQKRRPTHVILGFFTFFRTHFFPPCGRRTSSPIMIIDSTVKILCPRVFDWNWGGQSSARGIRGAADPRNSVLVAVEMVQFRHRDSLREKTTDEACGDTPEQGADPVDPPTLPLSRNDCRSQAAGRVGRRRDRRLSLHTMIA